MGKKKFFDFVIGNPPYQIQNSENNRQPPVYNDFMDAAETVADEVELITPARFLFNAGQTPKAWNEKKLNDKHFKVLKYEPNGALVFPNTDIKGGLAISIYNHNKDYGKIGTFTAYNELNSVLQKINNFTETTSKHLDSYVSSRGLYRFTEEFFKDFTSAATRLGKGNGNMLGSDIFERIPEAFHDTKGKDDIQILGRLNNQRVFRCIQAKYVFPNSFLMSYNVAFAKASGRGSFGETLGTLTILAPGIGVTDTFLSVGNLQTKTEAMHLYKYLQTKFLRALLSIKKITQNMTKAVWVLIPVQNFSSNSDIDWSKSIHDIDLQLYKKYGLSTDEIKFIESHVKEMA